LQYCSWHAAEVIEAWYRQAGKYTKDQIKVLKTHSYTYIFSTTLEAVDFNRKQLIDLL